MEFKHTPVLLVEVIEALRVEKGGKYIDATIGGGGHGVEILKRGGVLLGIDQDPAAIEFVSGRWKVESRKLNIDEENLTLVRGNFRDIKQIAEQNGFEKVAGILFDLGMSSYQLEQSGRGLSFLKDEPLDMRMSPSNALTAADIINTWTKEELYELFSKMAEERNFRVFSNAIVNARRIKKITTSKELASIIERVSTENGKIPASTRYTSSTRGRHPATKIFQALRIVVNNELDNLKKGVENGFELLQNEARMVVISFHSLEDRIVKQMFRGFEAEGVSRVVTKKPIVPSSLEVSQNPRARSAKMRVIERL